MTHKEMTAHLRTCIKRYGIKARVTMGVCCGSKVITVFVQKYDVRFSSKEIYNFCMAAKSNGLEFVMGVEIKPEHESKLTGKQQWDFFYKGE